MAEGESDGGQHMVLYCFFDNVILCFPGVGRPYNLHTWPLGRSNSAHGEGIGTSPKDRQQPPDIDPWLSEHTQGAPRNPTIRDPWRQCVCENYVLWDKFRDLRDLRPHSSVGEPTSPDTLQCPRVRVLLQTGPKHAKPAKPVLKMTLRIVSLNRH